MEGNIKVKIQTSDMIAIHQGDFTVTIHTQRMCGFIQELALAKRRDTQLKPEKIRTDELSNQTEKLYTEALLEVLSKAVAEEINGLKKQIYGVLCPAMQVHPCYLSNPQGKIDHNFDNTLKLVDL